MSGVGKTTLLEKVYNTYKVSNVFDVVIWVTVGQGTSLVDLQNCIARTINLKLSIDNSIDMIKMKLSAYLNTKKFLVVLDDLWRGLDLTELGVEFVNDKGSKVLFSTRSIDVIQEMGAAETSIRIQPLSKEEGWELFRSEAFSDEIFREALIHKAFRKALKYTAFQEALICEAFKGFNRAPEAFTGSDVFADASFKSAFIKAYRKFFMNVFEPPEASKALEKAIKAAEQASRFLPEASKTLEKTFNEVLKEEAFKYLNGAHEAFTALDIYAEAFEEAYRDFFMNIFEHPKAFSEDRPEASKALEKAVEAAKQASRFLPEASKASNTLENAFNEVLKDEGFKTVNEVLKMRNLKAYCSILHYSVKVFYEALKEQAFKAFLKDPAFKALKNPAVKDLYIRQWLSDIPRELAGECRGLPLAINVIAASMKHKTTVTEWNLALEQIRTRHMNPSGTFHVLDREPYSILKWGYHRLPDDNLKHCFLCCAMFPADEEIEVDKLVGMWIAEGLVQSEAPASFMDIAHYYIKYL